MKTLWLGWQQSSESSVAQLELAKPRLQKALLDTLATPLCSSRGICAVVGRTVDVLVVITGALALLLALVAAGALLVSRRR